jgi:hypothetical protein
MYAALQLLLSSVATVHLLAMLARLMLPILCQQTKDLLCVGLHVLPSIVVLLLRSSPRMTMVSCLEKMLRSRKLLLHRAGLMRSYDR